MIKILLCKRHNIVARFLTPWVLLIALMEPPEIGIICHCCPCCCAQLGAGTKHGRYDLVPKGAYIASIDKADCTGCGSCVDECPMKAIWPEEGDGTVRVDLERCIGCGLCVPSCPSGAISLVRRSQLPLLPKNIMEWTEKAVLLRFEQTGDPFSDATGPLSAGNRSIMRLAPIPLFFARDPERAVEMAAENSRTTHGARAAVDACRYTAGLIVGAVQGTGKDELLSPLYGPVPGCWEREPLVPEIEEIARGSFKSRNPPEIRGTGYVVRSLEAALWAFHGSGSFREGCLEAVNLGEDADKTGAVFGQIAGAFYGHLGIPEPWRTGVAHHDLIDSFARKLHALSGMPEGKY